jgi:outer membrane lipoprotein-sorting protein
MRPKLSKFLVPMIVAAVLAVLIQVALMSKEKDLTGNELLGKVVFFNQSKDQTAIMKMTLMDKSGGKIVKEMKVWGKGELLRLIKFTFPADVKGTGFLVQDSNLATEKMYVYLSAFKKTKRIAGSAKGESFMDSDFSYSDMGSFDYSKDYDAKRLADENDLYVLDLTKKPGSGREYDQMKVWVSMETFVPKKVEFYDLKKVGTESRLELRKIMNVEKVEKIRGLWVPTSMIMEDVKKKHKTTLELSNIEIDKGLSDDIFTERYLERK